LAGLARVDQRVRASGGRVGSCAARDPRTAGRRGAARRAGRTGIEAGISARSCINEDGLPLREPRYGSRRTTGSSDKEPQTREEQPDENLLRWTGRSQQADLVRDRGQGWKGDRAGRDTYDTGGPLAAADDVSLWAGNPGRSRDRYRCLLRRPPARSTRARSDRGRRARGTDQGAPAEPEKRRTGCFGAVRGIATRNLPLDRARSRSGDLPSARHAVAAPSLRAPAGGAGGCRQGVASRGRVWGA
jgi:hypothetical protein